MTLSDRYRRLARLIDALESQGLDVRSAAPADEHASESTGERMSVQLELELPSGTVLDQLADTAPERVAGDVDDAAEDEAHSSPQPERTTDDDASDRPEASTSPDDATDEATPTTATDDAADGSSTDDETDETEETSDDTVSTDAETTDEPDGIDCTHPECDRTFESERGMKIHRTKAHSLAELIDSGTDEAVHCDPQELARVYEQYDTFAEMTDALNVDVGPQAVRKQMIRHDIHQPGVTNPAQPTDSAGADASAGDAHNGSVADGGSVVAVDTDLDAPDSTTDEADDQSSEAVTVHGTDDRSASADDEPTATDDPGEGDPAPEAVADDDVVEDEDAADGGTDDDDEVAVEQLPDLDLPASLTPDEFRTAVEEATTLYDVQRALDLDRETTRDLLREYDLLDLVCGRAASVGEREQLKTEIHERLQRAAT